MTFKAGDRVRIKGTNEIVTVQAKGNLGDLADYINIDRLPFRYDNFNYGKGINCHSHFKLNSFQKLTKLERALQ